ncbi:ABC transporter permease [Helicovermis profundi]|uniref:ABC transporter permease n=1 Tax=Helicovermis profundi TaxID=3065157 RepID=A0AAU9E9Z0_9FIRM|nr:ABC transporter permease [Clostridia bacterium S502]
MVKNNLENSDIEEIDKSLFEFAKYDSKKAELIGYSNYSYWKSTLNVFTKNKVAVFLLVVVVFLLLFTVVQPYLPNQHSPIKINIDEKTGLQLRNLPPSAEYWFGTNSIGQDLWSRIWSGTRTSLFIGLTVGFIELIIGIFIGSIWGYVRKFDPIITEIYNVITNVPTTIILILIAYIMKPGIITIIVAMSVTRWTNMARFVRNLVIIIRDREYNLASRCLGTPLSRIATKNLLPYLVSVIMLRLALAIPLAIGSEVFLTYIGIGLPVDVPSLGNLINEGRVFMMVPSLRYQLLFPTAVLSIITISFYVMGNAFGDASDPKNHL